jgi:hypothetical protein
MSHKTIIYIGLFFLFLCSGCGLKEGVVNTETKSYLWFTGDTQGAVVYIDDLDPFYLDRQGNKNSNGHVHYKISSGKHTIKIKKSGVEIVNRTLLLGNGITKEIQVP